MYKLGLGLVNFVSFMIELKTAYKSFSKKAVLSDINIKIDSGDCLAIVGANGSGKSTLLNGLLGLLDFDKGELSIDGKTYSKQTHEIRKETGCIPEETFLIEHFTGHEFLYFHALLLSVEKKMIKPRINELTKLFFKDSTKIHMPISTYSLGMKRRIEICASLINSPNILIYDEPFNGLDPVFCRLFISIIKKMTNLGKKIIISSHDLDYVKDVATNIIMLDNGKCVFSGKKDAFFSLEQSNLDSFFYYLPNKKYDDGKIQLPKWL